MSLLQNQDFVLYRIRNRYLNCMRDGVGERLITVNTTALNVPAFKNAGWGCPSEIRRTYSPPIPVGASTEYPTSRAPLSNRDTDSSPVPSLQQHYQQQQVGGVDLGRSFMRPGLASHFSNESIDTVDTGFTGNNGRLEEVKEKVRREHHGDREDDSSDMSEESEDEETGTVPSQKMQLDFAKKEIPQRPRSGSSPLRSGPRVPESSITRSRARRLRGGSHGDLDFNAKVHHPSNSPPKHSEGILSSGLMGASERLHAEISDKPHSSPNSSSLTHTSSFGDDEDDDSDASSLDSDFTETADSDPTSAFPSKGGLPSSPGILHALPPPIRPVSMIQPVSLLTQLLKAKASEAANPMEEYQQFAGKGELAPITLKLYIPYSKSSSPFEVIIKRTRKVQSGDTTVAEAIGFTLCKYIEDKKEPELRDELCDINKWVLRMVDDGEPDEDFPPLERTQPITVYIAQGGRRGRGGVAKLEGEFALVEATGDQYLENERTTPSANPPKKKPATIQPTLTIPTTELIPPTPSTPFQISPSTITLTSTFPIIPPTPNTPSTPLAPTKTLRIHISPTSTFAHSIPLTIPLTTPLSQILHQICLKKSLQPDQHILRITNAPSLAILPLNAAVSTLGAQTDLDLVRNPTLPPPPPAPAVPQTPAREEEAYVPPEADYHRFTLYRKSTTPISFLSRHYERVLAMDGEYLHIQSARKTKSVHVSTIIGAKVCGKGGVGVKVFVWRGSGAGGGGGVGGVSGGGGVGKERKFEFEAGSAEVAEEVVGVVRRGIEGWGGGSGRGE
ncbi:hypothetical protein L873DRAFT_1846464 [Choiromyces venosus 120613-1]|uniref:Uncharacterized protein n=1 Tax=Choiromyces venosus 120613-1 TaxID=1336337 RepID=A0A3N4JE51_9PEZI|nr:hypothetical protein L873DRAFT_1846464 [Choiromyces venosus 120613-1]